MSDSFRRSIITRVPWAPTPMHAAVILSPGAMWPRPPRTRRGRTVRAAAEVAAPRNDRLEKVRFGRSIVASVWARPCRGSGVVVSAHVIADMNNAADVYSAEPLGCGVIYVEWSLLGNRFDGQIPRRPGQPR